MNPTIYYFDPATWADSSAILVMSAIQKSTLERGSCDVMLTGGRSAASLYGAWARLPNFCEMRGVRFYFGDERCVPPDSVESNYGMAIRTLFHRGIPDGCTLFRIEADEVDPEAVARRYATLLPSKIDVMLLGVGEDGHIASLFPNSASMQEMGQPVVSVIGPKRPFERITITPIVIMQARSIFVLAAGTSKAEVLAKALKAPSDFATMPARLVLNATWLLDSAGAEPNCLEQD
jgi:6-phosphogluconolactonase